MFFRRAFFFICRKEFDPCENQGEAEEIVPVREREPAFSLCDKQIEAEVT